MNISSLNNFIPSYTSQVLENDQTSENSSAAQKGEASFGQIINQKIEEANALQKNADQLTESYLAGDPVDIHQMLIAMEKADLALRETVEIRNKVVDAYQQIERMQI